MDNQKDPMTALVFVDHKEKANKEAVQAVLVDFVGCDLVPCIMDYYIWKLLDAPCVYPGIDHFHQCGLPESVHPFNVTAFRHAFAEWYSKVVEARWMKVATEKCYAHKDYDANSGCTDQSKGWISTGGNLLQLKISHEFLKPKVEHIVNIQPQDLPYFRDILPFSLLRQEISL